MATVTVFFAKSNRRSRTLADAAFKGLRAIGETPRLMDSSLYSGVHSDYAVFYGLACGLDRVFEDYKKQATAVYIDLGYWHRRLGGRYEGYHKVIVNSRHPTEYFQARKHDPKRFKQLGLTLAPWRPPGSHILLAGMSEKAALAEGLDAQAWERNALASIKATTDIPVVYRPKPNCRQSRPLTGARFDRQSSLTAMFNDCHAVVARQSNTSVDALLAGVPVFCEHGVASAMAQNDLSLIETPSYPDGRQQWAEDVAWCQFTPAEIAAGIPFRHLKDEGLLP